MKFMVGDKVRLTNLTVELEDLYQKVGVVVQVGPGEMISVGYGTPLDEDIAHVFPWEIRPVFKEQDIVRLYPPHSRYPQLYDRWGIIIREWTNDFYFVDFFMHDNQPYFFSAEELCPLRGSQIHMQSLKEYA